jgi:hypothetical protein
MYIRFLHSENVVVDQWHPACHSGTGVLRIVGTGRIIDLDTLRQDQDAKIITDDPEQVCRILGIPYPDPQVIEG